MVLGAAIVVVDLGLNPGLAESVGNVEGLEVGDVVLEQGSAVASAGEDLAGGLNLEAAHKHLPREILVSRNLDEFELVHRAGIDAVDDANRVRGALLLDLDGGVEVAAALEVVEKVAFALVQQVVVESVFLVDRDLFFQKAAADVKTLSGDDNDRSGFDQVGIVDGVRFGLVFLFCNRDLGENVLLLLKLLAQALKRIGDPCGGNALAGVHPGDFLELALRKCCVSRGFHFADVGGLSGRDMKEDADLLGGGIGSAFGGDAGAVISVLLHELPDVPQGSVELIESIEFAELELGGIQGLVGVGLTGSTFHVDSADKKVKHGSECEPHIRTGGRDFGLDVGKAPGGEQDADAFADLVAVERLAGFLRDHLQQVVAVRHARQFDGADGTSRISRHGIES